MEKNDIAKFVEGLDKGLQEKLTTCNSKEEFMNILKDAGVDMDPGMLEAFSGGNECSYLCYTRKDCSGNSCPQCWY